MHTQTDYAPGVMIALQLVTKYKNDMSVLLNIPPPSPCSIKNAEIFEILSSEKCRGFEFDDEDRATLKSSPAEPRIKRMVRNLNSNDVLENLNLVVKNSYKKFGGYVLTPRGLSISREEIIALVENYKLRNKKQHVSILQEHIDSLYNPSVEAIESEKLPTSSMVSSYAREADSDAAVIERSDGYCESCNSLFEQNKSGGYVCDIHHIFDEAAADEANMSNKRMNSINHKAALCGTCHRIIHNAICGDEQNRKLLTKIQKINKLLHETTTSKETNDIKKEIIIPQASIRPI